MGSKERQLSYSIEFKDEVVNYAEKHGVKVRVNTTVKMILVAVTTIFFISMMNKLYYHC
jgi:hypothetical protein